MTDTTLQFLDPVGLASSPNYSHIALVAPGATVHVSGQIALDAAGRLVGEGDLAQQTTQVYENLAACLEAAGAGFRDVFKVHTYVVDLTPEKADVVREVRARYLPAGHRPASTMVGVTSLVRPDLLVEVEVLAIVPQPRG